jgi:hypothetical protein
MNRIIYDEEQHGDRGSVAYWTAALSAALVGALEGLARFDPTLIPPGIIEVVDTSLLLVIIPLALLWMNYKRIQREKEALAKPSPEQEEVIKSKDREVETLKRHLTHAADE